MNIAIHKQNLIRKGVQMNKAITLLKQGEIGGLMAGKRRFNGGLYVFLSPKKIHLSHLFFQSLRLGTTVAIITKYTGKDLLNAERASGEILPAKKVSTTL